MFAHLTSCAICCGSRETTSVLLVRSGDWTGGVKKVALFSPPLLLSVMIELFVRAGVAAQFSLIVLLFFFCITFCYARGLFAVAFCAAVGRVTHSG